MAIKSAQASATGTLVSGPARVLAVHWVQTGSAGTVVLKDGGAGGSTLLTIDSAASAQHSRNLDIGGGGMHFATDVHVTLTAVAFVTIIYDG